MTDDEPRPPGLLARSLRAAPPWHGAPPALPALLDRGAERWFALPPRVRVAIATITVVAVLLLAGAGAARSPWGPPLDVLVATERLPAGASLGAESTQRVAWPAGLVPGDAVPADDGVGTGESLGVGVVAGSVITRRHLAGDAGVAAGLGVGRAAFPLEAMAFGDLRDGQRVDVVAGDLDGRGRTLARDARVLATTPETVWLDIARDEAAGLAAAAARDAIRVVVLPP